MQAYDKAGAVLTARNAAGDTLQVRSKNDSDPVYPSQWVTMTAVGSTFAPRVELVAGSSAMVWWEVDDEFLTNGTAPDMDFGSAGTRVVKMGVTGGGADKLDDVAVINLGFDVSSDAGWYAVPASYNHDSQEVTAISGLTQCTNLKYFLAAHPVEYDGSSTGRVLEGQLDVSGLSKLEFIECYYANLDSIDLTGCTSLVRVCLEHNNLTEIDLNPVRTNLKDLRCATQRGGVLTVAPLEGPLTQLYHFCARDQQVNGVPTPTQLPVVSEVFMWNTGLTSFTARSTSLKSVLVYLNSALASLDVTDQFPLGSFGVIQAFGCALTSLDLTGCEGVTHIDVRNNNFDAAAVDAIIAVVDSFGEAGSTLDVSLNVPPTSASDGHIASLRARGWTVIVD